MAAHATLAAPAPPVTPELVARLRARATEAEIARNVPAESIAELRSCGAFRTWQAGRFEGAESSVLEHLAVVSAIAEGCASTAWVCGVYHAHSWLLAHFPDAAQHDVYGADADALTSAVITPRGKARRLPSGDFELAGVWPFCSGVASAGWVILGAVIEDETGNVIDEGEFLLPKTDVEVLNDWRAAGLAGTGSHTVRVTRQNVPAHRVISLPALVQGKLSATQQSALYRAPAVPLLTIALTGASIGAARGALSDYFAATQGRPIAYTDHAADAWPVRLVCAGAAAARIEAAALLLERCASAIDAAAAAASGAMSVADRARARMDCAQAVRFAMEATDALWLASGGAGVALSTPVQRAARDLHAINNHGLLAHDVNAELYGLVLSGRAPNTPLI